MAQVPVDPDLEELRATAATCTACPLYRDATQTVFGKGLTRSEVMLVGEQPGDKEDLEGRPFVGPAGKELDRGLDAVGIDRSDAYVTNIVKHFKWQARGKRRIHQKPSAREESACRPWLDAELEQLKPQVFVCLGATAAQALLGAKFRVTRDRGTFAPGPAGIWSTATVHPSSLLRAPDAATRESEIKRFVDDLRGVAQWIEKGPPARRG